MNGLFGLLEKQNKIIYKNEIFKKVDQLLELHTLDTVDLLNEYYLRRLQQQNELQEAKDGILTIKLMFTENSLRVYVLNASNIKALDINGTVHTDLILKQYTSV